ncbi:MAG: hypothetical protein L6R37_002199 [Teloschistes peruensis]|nr:MAG: hypothetical protein L6R37_002199 [Teloschistes peruensis]
MALERDRAMKRSSSAVNFDLPDLKRRNLAPIRRHKITCDIDGGNASELAFHDAGAAETLLTRSIGLALDVVGFDAAEPLALESFRVAAEEYMRSLMADMRKSMLSSRRTQATAQDFLQALHTHQLSLRALLPHLRPPISTRSARVTLPHELPEKDEQYSHEFLGARFNGALLEKGKPYIPRNFPVLPSRHTYKATAEYPVREEDPRKVREQATGEGRLGEEALRRLVSARAVDRPPSVPTGRRVKSVRERRDEMWKETMQAMSSIHASGKSHMGDNMDLDEPGQRNDLSDASRSEYDRVSSAVNADKRYWRKPAPFDKNGGSSSSGN